MITTGVAKFILIVVFAHANGGQRVGFTTIGEYNTMEACQNAASASLSAHASLDVIGKVQPKFVCANKGKQ